MNYLDLNRGTCLHHHPESMEVTDQVAPYFDYNIHQYSPHLVKNSPIYSWFSYLVSFLESEFNSGFWIACRREGEAKVVRTSEKTVDDEHFAKLSLKNFLGKVLVHMKYKWLYFRKLKDLLKDLFLRQLIHMCCCPVCVCHIHFLEGEQNV